MICKERRVTELESAQYLTPNMRDNRMKAEKQQGTGELLTSWKMTALNGVSLRRL